MHSVAGLVYSDFGYPSLDYDDLLSLTLHLTKSVQEVEKVFRLACLISFRTTMMTMPKTFCTLKISNKEEQAYSSM